MSASAIAWILLGALVLSAGVGFTAAAVLVNRSVRWLKGGSRTWALMLVVVLCGLCLWSTVSRIAVILGLTAGLCHLLVRRPIRGEIRLALGWLQIVVGGLIATSSVVLFADNLTVLLVLLSWGIASAAAGALLVERQPAEVERIETESNPNPPAEVPVAIAVEVAEPR